MEDDAEPCPDSDSLLESEPRRTKHVTFKGDLEQYQRSRYGRRIIPPKRLKLLSYDRVLAASLGGNAVADTSLSRTRHTAKLTTLNTSHSHSHSQLRYTQLLEKRIKTTYSFAFLPCSCKHKNKEKFPNYKLNKNINTKIK